MKIFFAFPVELAVALAKSHQVLEVLKQLLGFFLNDLRVEEAHGLSSALNKLHWVYPSYPIGLGGRSPCRFPASTGSRPSLGWRMEF
jgi:hypothetical protein